MLIDRGSLIILEFIIIFFRVRMHPAVFIKKNYLIIFGLNCSFMLLNWFRCGHSLTKNEQKYIKIGSI
jgi:hypothetical protein